MTAFNNIKTNNWPAASNDLEDFLVLELPLNDQAALTSSRRDIVAGSTVLYPKRTLTSTGVSLVSAVGIIYSSGVSSTNGLKAAHPAANIFDGSTSTHAQNNLSNDNSITVDFSSNPINYTSSVRIYTYAANGYSITNTYYLNGSSTGTDFVGGGAGFNGAAWTTVASGTGTITEIKLRLRRSGSSSATFYAIEVDGTILQDGSPKKHYDNNANFTAAAQPGSGHRLSVDNFDNFSMGSNESWCFEAWINPRQVDDATVFGVGNTGIGYRIITGTPYLYIGAAGNVLPAGTIAVHTWTHVALTRDVNTLRSFINGTQVGSDTTNSGSWDVTSGTGAGVFIGAANLTGASTPNYHFDGLIQDLRFYKGAAKYTANFTPPGAILG